MYIILALLLVINSCKKDSCEDREPPVINYNEIVSLKILTGDNVCVFTNVFNEDTLKLIENNESIQYVYDKKNCEIDFKSNVFSFDNIKDHFGTILSTEIYIYYDFQTIDTLIFEAKPVGIPELCYKTFYEYSSIKYNSEIIREIEGESLCFACETIIINRN